jgi:hypothetical protein
MLKDVMKTENKRRKELILELIKIVEFLFFNAVQDIMDDFNRRFSSKVDNVAYDRTILLGIYLYSIKRHDLTMNAISDRCLFDDYTENFHL